MWWHGSDMAALSLVMSLLCFCCCSYHGGGGQHSSPLYGYINNQRYNVSTNKKHTNGRLGRRLPPQPMWLGYRSVQ
jgi:hypothetical protein